MLKKITGTFLTTAIAFSAFAQVDSSKPTISFSGSVDAYYRISGGKADDAPVTNNYTSFTNSANSFELGMASLRADASVLNGKVGATVDLGYGTRADEFSYNDYGRTLQIIKQAFVTYSPTENLKFTAGKFGTHVGYEVLDPIVNRNYSMGYMFSYGPFFHTGIKADITAGAAGFMVGVANHVDWSTYDGTTSNIKDLLAQFSIGAGDNWKFYLNYWGFFGAKSGHSTNGGESTSQIDFVATGTITEKFNIGVNATMQSIKLPGMDAKSWGGAALYLNVDPTEHFGLTLRGEYISDKDGIKFNDNLWGFTPESIFQSTLSLNFTAGPLKIIPEVRLDSFKNEGFFKSNGDLNKSHVSGLVAAILAF